MAEPRATDAAIEDSGDRGLPDLLVIIGPIASGKTTVAEGLAFDLRQAGRVVAVTDVDGMVEAVGGFLGLTDERFRQAQKVHGQLVGAWLREGIPVIAHGPFYEPDEIRAVISYLPEGTPVRWVLLRCAYATALERVSADPNRKLSRDPTILRRAYDRYEALVPGLPHCNWIYDTTVVSAQAVIGQLAANIGMVGRTWRGRVQQPEGTAE